MARIRRIEVKGFRAFGGKAQAMGLGAPLAIIYGENSQGKTSLAEAIEFLLTGKTVRRELLASAKREFADALRHAQLDASEPVYVKAVIIDDKGHEHHVERTLVRDYTPQAQCETELVIDGAPASDLSSLGIYLSQPPLEAPVLMSHTLRFVISADPKQRTDYFKALLEVADLEEVREAISSVRGDLEPPSCDIEKTYRRCAETPCFAHALAPLEESAPSQQQVRDRLNDALAVILSEVDALPESLDDRIVLAKTLLKERRATTFPLDALEPGEQLRTISPDDSWWSRLLRFIRVRESVDERVLQLIPVFQALLEVPCIRDATEPINCPVCETPNALTPERIQVIREDLKAKTEFQTAKRDAQNALQSISDIMRGLEKAVSAACPSFLKWDDSERERRGFSDDRIKSLLTEGSVQLFEQWKGTTTKLEGSLHSLEDALRRLQDHLRELRLDALGSADVQELRTMMQSVVDRQKEFIAVLDAYARNSKPLLEALREEVDRRAKTEGWQDLIRLAEEERELFDWLVSKYAHSKVVEEIRQAEREIDEAKAHVLDAKYSELSSEIRRWWNLLRPKEPTSFRGVERVGKGRRYVGLKAQLASDPDGRGGSTVRDAVAVLSDSQLNCLCLAAFLARSVRAGAGFVVLDDPVPASDADHRASFVVHVVKELVDASVQVILFSHDQYVWKDVQERYKHLNPDTFLLTLENEQEGAVIRDRSDTLLAMIAEAKDYIVSPDPVIRRIGAQKLRNAAERFCKLLLVKYRRDQGESVAVLSDYDGKNLGELEQKAGPLLNKDPSHPGKLGAIRRCLNPGSHDAPVPQADALKQCLGDLKFLIKEYLPAEQ